MYLWGVQHDDSTARQFPGIRFVPPLFFVMFLLILAYALSYDFSPHFGSALERLTQVVGSLACVKCELCGRYFILNCCVLLNLCCCCLEPAFVLWLWCVWVLDLDYGIEFYRIVEQRRLGNVVGRFCKAWSRRRLKVIEYGSFLFGLWYEA